MIQRGKKRRVKLLSIVWRSVVILSAVALVLSYLSVYINPVKVTLPLFFGLYFIPLVLLNLLLLTIGLFRKSKSSWITFVILLPSILYAELFVRWGEAQRGEEGIALKICSYNVGLFAQGRGKSRAENFKRIKEFIESEEPDIVALQEFQIEDSSLIRENFPNYPHLYCHLFNGTNRKFGNLTLSKYPIVESGKITFNRSTNLCIYTDIEHYGKIIRLYNLHLESHSISFTSLIKRMGERERIKEELYQVHDRLASTFKKRARQVDTISNHLKKSSLPSIICGDFNDTPVSYTYRNLSSGIDDSFRKSGRGFSATYSFLWPLLRIDYILYPNPFWSLEHRTPKIKDSDHYPIISTLIIP